ncbi:MAG TPA: tRNA uridine-5-carboxymethylaminomethyl(34) synthesis GTPase MnmE [Armatimonadota bacterium]|jgi:tRNA modification GTPase
MTFYNDDTIAAIATPIGDGGIGIVRISGREAVAVASRMFQTTSKIHVDDLPSHTVHYGYAIDPECKTHIDDGLITIFRGPKSYTGEDSVEISCHGGIVPMRKVLEAALRSGARLAEPGEFTKRAFMNGRLDLVQAEAVLDIIRARTDEALRVARRQLDGVLSEKIRSLRGEMLGIIAHIEACIDFPEDVEEWQPGRMVGSIKEAISHVKGLLETADKGKIYREGIQTVITGSPNVGKSSLLNALLRESRAIVTPIPGTTRDIIEESLSIGGIPVRAVDTAGVRETDDPIEQIGVQRAKDAIENADLVIAVVDAEAGFTSEDEKMLKGLAAKKFIVALNKSDLFRQSDAAALAARIQSWMRSELNLDIPVLNTAATWNDGIVELEKAIADSIFAGGIPYTDGPVVSNVRHRRALEEALEGLERSVQTAQAGMSLDFICIDLRTAIDALGRITGETVADDVIDRIFSEFCIGK